MENLSKYFKDPGQELPMLNRGFAKKILVPAVKQSSPIETVRKSISSSIKSIGEIPL